MDDGDKGALTATLFAGLMFGAAAGYHVRMPDENLGDRLDVIEAKLDRIGTVVSDHSIGSVGDVAGSVTIASEAPRRILTTAEVAAELGCNPDTVRRRHDAGTLEGWQSAGWNQWRRVDP